MTGNEPALDDEFEGGEVCFPEYGPRGFKAPAGGTVVFSCSLLHRVGRVTSGRRHAFLSFLHDEAAARIRVENARFIGAADGSRDRPQGSMCRFTRRFRAPFFSILPILSRPISPVRATWVPPQG